MLNRLETQVVESVLDAELEELHVELLETHFCLQRSPAEVAQRAQQLDSEAAYANRHQTVDGLL